MKPASDASRKMDTIGSAQKRVVMSRLVQRRSMDESFDLEFWQEVDADTRVSVLWDMVHEYRLMRGEDGEQPRLQRSVAVLQPRRR